MKQFSPQLRKSVSLYADIALVTRLENLIKMENKDDQQIADIKEILEDFEEIKKFFEGLPDALYTKFIEHIDIEMWSSQSMIFHKGDPSDKFFLIISGNVQILNVNKFGQMTEVAVIGKGKTLGERGVIRSQSRSLSAMAKNKVTLLSLSAYWFIEILGDAFFKVMDAKLDFIDKYIPNTELLGNIHKERLVYAMAIEIYPKNTDVVINGTESQHVYYIYDGVCGIYKKDKQYLSLGVGSYFGEEHILLGNASDSTVRVNSVKAQLIKIKKNDFLKLIPGPTIEKMREIATIRESSRNVLPSYTSTTMRRNKSEPSGIGVREKYTPFLHASSAARQRIMKAESSKRLKTSTPENNARTSTLLKKLTIVNYKATKSPKHKKYLLRKDIKQDLKKQREKSTENKPRDKSEERKQRDKTPDLPRAKTFDSLAHNSRSNPKERPSSMILPSFMNFKKVIGLRFK